jgi:diguanylate cyclase (GGDEF)-like protein
VTSADGRTILIVEDDPEIQYLLSFVLDEPDRTVEAVSTAAEAEEILASRDVDLVVLDLILPDADGRSLLTSMRRRPETASVPVVVISARGGSESRQECYDLGADHYLEKPFDADELAADVTARLERSADRERVSLVDAVTGLLNQAGLADAASDGDADYGLSLVQLDGFSMLAERWGWSEAQDVLREVGSAIASATDGQAYSGRIGGGEFGIMMVAAQLDAGVALAEKILGAVRDLPLKDPSGEALRLTASAGVVLLDRGTPMEEGLETARRRLFIAREAGGDRVAAIGMLPEGATPRLLVAEDDEISATLLLHRLRKEGLEIVRFENGRDAYEAALKETPNLVILDVKMPGMDGFEVLERLRKVPAYHRVPIILLTSMGSESDVVRGFQLGADDYILKPFSPMELSARVWRLLRRGRSATTI